MMMMVFVLVMIDSIVVLGLVMAALSGRFMRDGERGSFRKLFLFTLLYLPLELGLLAFAWS